MYYWSKNLSTATTVTVLPMNSQKLVMYILISLLTAAVLGTLMQQNTDASFAYADAFTTCASLVAFVLMTRRYIVNWLFWIAVDLVAIVVYFQKGLYPTVVLYLCFLVMAIVGYYSWKKEFK